MRDRSRQFKTCAGFDVALCGLYEVSSLQAEDVRARHKSAPRSRRVA